MKFNKEYELSLNWMSMCEVLEYRDNYYDYAQTAILMLDFDSKYMFEDDLLKEHKRESIQELITEYINRFYHTGTSKRKSPNEKDSPFVKVWYDLFADIIVERNNPLYPHFFTYKLRETDLLKIDALMDYQSQKWGEENLEMFIRFVRLVARKNEGQLLTDAIVLTVMEWVQKKETEHALSGTDENSQIKVKTKGKPKREANDGQTALSQAQTALLFNYMKRARIFWQDDYLSNVEAGIAASVLTGYDKEAMRQNLGENKIKEHETPANLKKVTASLKNLIDLVSKDLPVK